jgi:hypothetical protein
VQVSPVQPQPGSMTMGVPGRHRDVHDRVGLVPRVGDPTEGVETRRRPVRDDYMRALRLQAGSDTCEQGPGVALGHVDATKDGNRATSPEILVERGIGRASGDQLASGPRDRGNHPAMLGAPAADVRGRTPAVDVDVPSAALCKPSVIMAFAALGERDHGDGRLPTP